MAELNDSSDLQAYSNAVLYVLSAVNPPPEYVATILGSFIDAIKSSTVCLLLYAIVISMLTALPVLANPAARDASSSGVLL